MADYGLARLAQQRRFFGSLDLGVGVTSTLLIYTAVFVLFASAFEPSARANELHADSDIVQPNHSDICNRSVDIRNTLDTFQRLKNCRIIEGFVQILLFDNVSEIEINKLSFPKLTEITDYLLLYRVNGLKSIGKLFPNLAVIRGQKLFYSYSFVIFEMSNLQEIGLYSLTDITNGIIRIDKNPSLCFVDSIDWDHIAHVKREHFIKNIKPENECPICPGETSSSDENKSAVSLSCPKAPKTLSENYERDKFLCWNMRHCQKICPSHCKSCNNRGQCCDDLCIGGCAEDDVRNCTVCRNFTMTFNNSRQCMSNCPSGYYEFLGRCITRQECINMEKPIDLTQNFENDRPYKIFNNSCLLDCPPNYMNDELNHVCLKCKGRCRKDCPGTNIDNIALAAELRGCTHITGSLEIQIRGGINVVSELEDNLSSIEEIYGYLKIVRSFSLVSLSFFKSLRRIHGNSLESQKYVFVVLDNQNLQGLWNWTGRTLQIDKGVLFFHFNPKLCLKAIEELRLKANLKPFTELEVASNSNGDKIACDVDPLTVRIAEVYTKSVLLEWSPYILDDQRKLLGYSVFSIEAAYRNVSMYDGRDACGGDGWKVDDVPIPEDPSPMLSYPLTSLKPYTQYGFFVKTYTIATERRGAQSGIYYFRTNPAMPSLPLGLKVTSNSSDSLKISWLPPTNPHGNLTHYRLTIKRHPIMPNSKTRDYCKDPPTSSKPQITPTITTPITISKAGNASESCSCQEGKKPKPNFDEAEEISRIKFEDALQNAVFIKSSSSGSKSKSSKSGDSSNNRVHRAVDNQIGNDETKRNTFEDDLLNGLAIKRKDSDRTKRQVQMPIVENPNQTEQSDLNKNITDNSTGKYLQYIVDVYGTSYYLQNLHHYAVYDVYVQACREPIKKDNESRCSSTTFMSKRTEKKPGSDNISTFKLANQSLETVTITWDLPQDPNGMILAFYIQYKRVDIENATPNSECINVKEAKNGPMVHTVKKLYPGNYSVRIKARSTAGDGEYTDYLHFYIEQPSSNVTTIVVSIAAVGTLLIFAAIYMYRKYINEKEITRLIPSVNPEYVSTVYVPDEWEVPRKNITVIKELGQGSFGMVYEGLAKDIRGKPEIRCAIKTVNEHSTNRERQEFLNEASTMKAFDTAHVVHLLGVVSQGQPTLVIMELMGNGDLKSYLRSHRPDADTSNKISSKHPPTLQQIMLMALEIADGMAYLEAKKFVHRDLAARNCMVSEDLIVKIGDFGMTRDIYETDYYRKGSKGLLPVRWMSPESLKDGLFSSSSDVWSYGVVLWEMTTLASQPYVGLSNDEVLRYVIDGGVMAAPENCPEKLYDLMRRCWQYKPSARPSFMKLCSLLVENADSRFMKVSFYHGPTAVEARTTKPIPLPPQDDQTTPLRTATDSATDSQESDGEADSNTTHIRFPSISEAPEGVTMLANGYVGGCATNGAATTQC